MFCVTLTPKAKVKGQILYFLLNAISPKPLDVAASYFADA